MYPGQDHSCDHRLRMLVASRAWRVPLTATLALLLAAPPIVTGCGPAEGDPPTHVASNAMPLEASTPRGDVSFPVEFRWDGAGRHEVVRIVVTDRAEREVFTFDARGSHAHAPPGLEAAVEAGETFLWTVSVVGADGDRQRTSSPAPFVPRP